MILFLAIFFSIVILLIIKSLLNIDNKKYINNEKYNTTSKPINTTSKPVNTTSKPVNTTSKPINTTSKPINNIPKILHQTYKDKNKIPKKVFQNIKKFASDYEHKIYDDKECFEFIKKNFDEKIYSIYNKINNGAHKADLFRYCVLYIEGGVYLDIKTELIKPLNEIFKENYIYTVLSIVENSIYQGIIAAPPKNIFFMNLINNYIDIFNNKKIYYHIFTQDFYNEIKKDVQNNNKENKVIKEGINIGKNNKFLLFTEKCNGNKNDCSDGLDRYRLCCHVTSNNVKIIKTRYSDFPW